MNIHALGQVCILAFAHVRLLTLCMIFVDAKSAETPWLSECIQKCGRQESSQELANIEPVYVFDGITQSNYALCLSDCHGKENPVLEGRDSIIILGPNDKIPTDLVMPSVIPRLPDWVTGNQGQSNERGNCKTQSLFTTNKVLNVAKDVTVDCLGKEETADGLVVRWKRPDGSKAITGYQLYFVIAEKPGVFGNAKYCYEIGKDNEEFIINRRNGFKMAKEISLMVVALPLPSSADIKLNKFSIQCDENNEVRKRRNSVDQMRINTTTKMTTLTTINTQPTSDNSVVQDQVIAVPTISTPNFVIIKDGDPIPTNLVMPSIIPTLPNSVSGNSDNSNCENGSPYNKRADYPGEAEIAAVNCRFTQQANVSKKEIIVYWKQPPGARTKVVKGFQIMYDVMKRNNYDRRRQFCLQVKPEIFSTLLKKGIGADVGNPLTLNIAIIALPWYDGGNVTLKKFSNPCTEHPPTTSIPSPPGEITEPKSNWKFIVSGVIAGVVLLGLLAGCQWWYRSHKKQPIMNDPPSNTGRRRFGKKPDLLSLEDETVCILEVA